MEFITNHINLIRSFFLEILINQIQNIRERIFPDVLKLISISILLVPIMLFSTGITNYFRFLLQSLVTYLISQTIILIIIFKDDLLRYFNDDDFFLVEHPQMDPPVLVEHTEMESSVLVEHTEMESSVLVEHTEMESSVLVEQPELDNDDLVVID
jgi:hypothetical protein